jgi:beta-lactamase class A
MTDYRFKEDKKISIGRPLLLTLLAGALALGIFIGAGMGMLAPLLGGRGEAAPESAEGTFKFIRASLESKNVERNQKNKELKPFRYKVNSIIEEGLKKGDASAISFYFRDLINGNRFGIGDADKFSPRSLLKLPLMIAYFKWSEMNPLVLRKTLTYKGSEIKAEQKIKPAYTLDPGRRYTVNDLIYRMIAYDDPAAYALLNANMPSNRLERIFKDLNVEYDPHQEDDSMSLSAFASFYRVLYNASYLPEDLSEKALRYLSKSAFRDGMASGVPLNVEIASKHGERTIEVLKDGKEMKLYQYHEFGIVYYPNRPFLIGIMARGNDIDRLTKVTRDITRLVYEEVDQQF